MILLSIISIIGLEFSQYDFLISNQMVSKDAQYIIFEHLLFDQPVAIDSVIPITEYEDLIYMYTSRELLASAIKKELLRRKTGGQRGFIDIIEIPLPKTKALSSIIGEKGKLDVGGSEKITFGGRQTFVSGEETQTQPSYFPELEMKQELKVKLDGSVGEKLHVLIDHDSERENESKNKVRLTYTGDEDEVIQEIEAGDTKLSIPPTSYTGDIPSHEGLFGVKSRARFGPLELTAIASREESKGKQATFQGQTQLMTDTLYGRDFMRRSFFTLGLSPADTVVYLEVWVDDHDPSPDPGEILRYGAAYVDTNEDNILDIDTSDYHSGQWARKNQGEFYYFLAGENILWLLQSLPEGHDLGIYFILKDGTEVGDTSYVDSSITLKLIAPDNLMPNSHAWYYERKNRYYIYEGVNLDTLRIFKKDPSGTPRETDKDNRPFVQVLGLDPNKDGKIELDHFNPTTGILTFPDSFPFWSDKLSEPDPIIYTKRHLDQNEGMMYFIVARYSVGQQFFSLGAFDILEGSEKVVVNGNVWNRGTDYNIDYEAGIVTFIRELPPNADVKIDYEYSPLFSITQRSLFGLRGEIEPIENAKFGSSVFYRKEGYPDFYPTLESEPYSRMIWEVDFVYPLEMDFLTNLADRLPIVETEAPSSFNTNCEVAISRTVLNTKGEVYLDDFDQATSFDRDFGVHPYTLWKFASKPAGKDTGDFIRNHRLVYYNPDVQYTKGNILESSPEPNTPVEILKVFFNPDQGNDSSFAGIMKGMDPWVDLSDCDMFEVVIKGSGGNIHIDLGTRMSEDQLRRDKGGSLVGLGEWDNEDKNRDGIFIVGNEDTGLDTVFGEDQQYPSIAGDDGNDDYQKNDYQGGINGTEDNGLWDNEDLNRDRGCYIGENDYVSYSFHLDSTRFQIENANLKSGWKLFRIPIKDSSTVDTFVNNSVDWEQVSFIRIWFDGFTEAESLFFYKVSAVGSRWENRGVQAVDNSYVYDYEKVEISPVNTTTHGYYKPPRGLRKDEFGRLEEEGALEVRIDSLRKNHRAVIFRRNEVDEDYRAYERISIYLHRLHSDPVFILRMGLDSLNYYQFQNRITEGEKGLNDYYRFDIDMENFVELKRRTQGSDTLNRANYSVIGNPSIASVHFFELSFLNDVGGFLSDTVWTNDLRLTQSKVEIGRIARGAANVNLADIASSSFSFNESNGLFRRLTDGPGISTSGRERSYGFSSHLEISKFLPKGWGFKIPLDYSTDQSQNWNRFSIYGTDIPLSPTEAERQSSRSKGDRLSVSLSKSNSKNWFMKKTIDRMNFSWNRSRSSATSPLNKDSSYQKTRAVQYGLDIGPKINIGKGEVNLIPRTVNLGLSLNENEASHYTRTDLDSSYVLQTYSRNKTANPSVGFDQTIYSFPGRKVSSSLRYGYSFNQSRDLLDDPIYDTLYWYGEEITRDQGFSATMSNRIAKIVTPTISFNANYGEDHRPEVRMETLDLRNVNNSGELRFSGTIEAQRLLYFLSRLRNESNDSTAQRGSPSWLLMQLEKLSDNISAPSLTYSIFQSSNFPAIRRRPIWKYQFGIIDTLPEGDLTPHGLGSHQRRRSFTGSSGFGVGRVRTRFGYSQTITRNYSFGTNVTESRTKAYPKLDLSVSGLERLPGLNNLFSTASANSYFEIGEELRGTIEAESLTPSELSKRYEFSPLVSLTTRLKKRAISFDIGTNYSKRKTTSYSSNITTDVVRETKGGDLAISYSFSAPQGIKIPGLKGIKFRSELAITASGNYQRTNEENITSGSITSDYSSMQSNLGLSYNFSSSVKGGSTFEYTTNTDHLLERSTKTVGLNFWVLFIF